MTRFDCSWVTWPHQTGCKFAPAGREATRRDRRCLVHRLTQHVLAVGGESHVDQHHGCLRGPKALSQRLSTHHQLLAADGRESVGEDALLQVDQYQCRNSGIEFDHGQGSWPVRRACYERSIRKRKPSTAPYCSGLRKRSASTPPFASTTR